jgi:hypothetical protein
MTNDVDQVWHAADEVDVDDFIAEMMLNASTDKTTTSDSDSEEKMNMLASFMKAMRDEAIPAAVDEEAVLQKLGMQIKKNMRGDAESHDSVYEDEEEDMGNRKMTSSERKTVIDRKLKKKMLTYGILKAMRDEDEEVLLRVVEKRKRELKRKLSWIWLAFAAAVFLVMGITFSYQFAGYLQDANDRYAVMLDPDAQEDGKTKSTADPSKAESARQVLAGIYMDRATDVSFVDSGWNLDFYLWFRWMDQAKNESVDVAGTVLTDGGFLGHNVKLDPGENFQIIDGKLLEKEELEYKVGPVNATTVRYSLNDWHVAPSTCAIVGGGVSISHLSLSADACMHDTVRENGNSMNSTV